MQMQVVSFFYGIKLPKNKTCKFFGGILLLFVKVYCFWVYLLVFSIINFILVKK